MPIILSKPGKPGGEVVAKSDFENERSMQEYIHEHPEAIPVYEIHKDKRLFVVAREFPTNSGPIDAFAVDGDGDIYVVETKLYQNPDKRLVIAQALDYGASLWKHFNDPDRLISLLEERVQNKWKLSFSSKLQQFFQKNEEGVEALLPRPWKSLRVSREKSWSPAASTATHFLQPSVMEAPRPVNLQFLSSCPNGTPCGISLPRGYAPPSCVRISI